MPKYIEREMFRGDSLGFELELMNPLTGAPLNITGAKFWFTAKNNYVDADERAVIRLDTALLGGVSIVDAARGLARVDVPPLATRALPDGIVRLVYDVQIREAGGSVSTIESGTIKIYPDVTRAIV